MQIFLQRCHKMIYVLSYIFPKSRQLVKLSLTIEYDEQEAVYLLPVHQFI